MYSQQRSISAKITNPTTKTTFATFTAIAPVTAMATVTAIATATAAAAAASNITTVAQPPLNRRSTAAQPATFDDASGVELLAR